MKTVADKIIEFNKQLHFTGELPEGIRIMNPFEEDQEVLRISSEFYKKYYDDTHARHLILGINPGRFGAGVTGIPFTDTKRLVEKCKIPYTGKITHEPSSVFVYEMIDAFGSVEAFYRHFHINAICPLGFTQLTPQGKEINYNYYDSKELTAAVYDFIVESIHKMVGFGMHTDICYCLGNGKNEAFLRKLNKEQKFFDRIIGLEHPRFVMQYRSKFKQVYIDKYMAAFAESIASLRSR